MKFKPLPSLDDLNTRFSYDPDTGTLTWLNGTPAGYLHKGYLCVKVLGIKYYGHRLIWKMMTGEDPDPSRVIDHIDRNGANNRWDNLRLVSISDNNKNRVLNYKGIYMPTSRKPTNKTTENKPTPAIPDPWVDTRPAIPDPAGPGSLKWRLQVAGLM